MSINKNSLTNPTPYTATYTGGATKTVVTEYIVLYPNGDSDDVRYPNHIQAWNSLTDCDDIIDLGRKEFGLCMTDIEESDCIQANVREWAEHLGYRVLDVLKVRE